MVEGLLALKWNHHHSTFFNVLAGLHNKAKFSDVTLACDGELFPTHKLVLSTCSDYFSTMLDNTQCKAPIIVLKDITKAHLRSLLGYMYLGEVEVHQDDLPDLLKAAECLHIKGLTFNNQSSDTPSTKKQKKEEVANSPSRKSKTIDSVSSPPTKRKKPTPNVESIEKDLLGDSNDVSSETANSKSIDATEKEQELSSKELYDEKEIKVETEEHLYEENTLDVNNLEGTENADNSVGDQDDESTLQEPKVDPLAVFEGAGPSCFPDSLWDQESDNSFGNSNSSGQQQMAMMFPEIKLEEFSRRFNSTPSSMLEEMDEKFLFCPLCSYKTNFHTQLERHIKNHANRREFKCHLCSYTSLHKGHLVRHVRVHTKEKPFHCDWCDYKSSRRDTLKAHISSQHLP